MSDIEVENTLREIRERVLADAQRRAPVAASNGVTGAGVGVEAAGAANGHGAPASEALARMDANLATTARAWSRLPPLLSYRRGAAARFEIWVKGLVKRALHWFTWEQVNFNAAVHHALGDARAVLAAQEQALARTREEFQGELRVLRADAEADRARDAELQARLARAEALVAEAQVRFESGGAQLRQAFAVGLERLAESQRATAEALRGELGGRASELHAETNARAAELHAELRVRLDGMLEEQRVCFKQLSLEAGEAAVTHDRARRQLEARLEAIERGGAGPSLRGGLD
jgi:hypothetical protein